jgi:hypothetical protein
MTEEFKDILFIDDMDDNDGFAVGSYDDETDDETNDIDAFFEKYFTDHRHIRLIKNFEAACGEIIGNSEKYNLVIFDMNMEKGFEKTSKEEERIKEQLSRYNINFESGSADDISGIYLYLLLQAKGYPSERMIILTGNYGRRLQNDLGKVVPSLILNNIVRQKVEEGSDENEKLNVESEFFLSENNSYYRIRRLVLAACQYWKKQLKDMDDADIPFNKVYGLTGREVRKKAGFVDALDSAEFSMPVIAPDGEDRKSVV